MRKPVFNAALNVKSCFWNYPKQFCLKVMVFKIVRKVIKILGSFWKKSCFQKLAKLIFLHYVSLKTYFATKKLIWFLAFLNRSEFRETTQRPIIFLHFVCLTFLSILLSTSWSDFKTIFCSIFWNFPRMKTLIVVYPFLSKFRSILHFFAVAVMIPSR